MQEDAEPQPLPPAVQRSRRLARAGIILGILPVLLPFPLWKLELLWIGPIDHQAWEQCQNFYCPAAIPLEQLATLLILGPSILVAIVSVLFSIIGLVRSRWRPTSPGNMSMLKASAICGLILAMIFGLFLMTSLALDTL